MRTESLVIALLLAAGQLPAIAQEDPGRKHKPNYTIGKETTFVDGPRDKDGRIDYVAALNLHLSRNVTPENNAVVPMCQAHGPRPRGPLQPEFFKRLGIAPPPDAGDYFVNFDQHCQKTVDFEKDAHRKWEAELERVSQRPWQAKFCPVSASWLKANEKPLAEVVRASKRTHFYYPLLPGPPDKEGVSAKLKLPGHLLYVHLGATQTCREFGRALVVRAMLRLGEGDHDGAWQDLLACHRLSRLVGQGGTLNEGLVGVALNEMVSDASIVFLDRAGPNIRFEKCLAELQKLPPMSDLSEKVNHYDRIMSLELLLDLDRFGAFNDLADKNALTSLRDDINWDRPLRNVNRMFDRLTAAMREPDRARRKELFAGINNDLRALNQKKNRVISLVAAVAALQPYAKIGYAIAPRLAASFELAGVASRKPLAQATANLLSEFMLPLVVPNGERVQEIADRNKQVQSNLLIALALARYQREHGRYPEKLEQLTPKHLVQVPLDLFSGKPLIYRASEKGYLLYSVGVNGKDDGGQKLYETAEEFRARVLAEFMGQAVADRELADDISISMPLTDVKRKP